MEEGSLFQRMKQIFHEDEMDEEMQKEAAGLIRNIFRYMDKDAKDIMTHRKNIVAIDGDWSLEEALQFMLDERFSRFPVYQEDIDEIIGIIHLRDATSGYLDKSKRQCPVKIWRNTSVRLHIFLKQRALILFSKKCRRLKIIWSLCWTNTDRLLALSQWKISWKRSSEIFWMNMMKKTK